MAATRITISPTETTLIGIQRSRQETVEAFDEQAQNVLGMTGTEFLRRLDAGELDAIIDDPIGYPGISYLVMLANSVR